MSKVMKVTVYQRLGPGSRNVLEFDHVVDLGFTSGGLMYWIKTHEGVTHRWPIADILEITEEPVA